MSLPKSQMDSTLEWHVLVRGQRLGPYRRAALYELLETHPDGWSAAVWRPGMLDWRPAQRVPALVQDSKPSAASARAAAAPRDVVPAAFPDLGPPDVVPAELPAAPAEVASAALPNIGPPEVAPVALSGAAPISEANAVPSDDAPADKVPLVPTPGVNSAGAELAPSAWKSFPAAVVLARPASAESEASDRTGDDIEAHDASAWMLVNTAELRVPEMPSEAVVALQLAAPSTPEISSRSAETTRDLPAFNPPRSVATRPPRSIPTRSPRVSARTAKLAWVVAGLVVLSAAFFLMTPSFEPAAKRIAPPTPPAVRLVLAAQPKPEAAPKTAAPRAAPEAPMPAASAAPAPASKPPARVAQLPAPEQRAQSAPRSRATVRASIGSRARPRASRRTLAAESQVTSVRVRSAWAPVRVGNDPAAKVMCSVPRGTLLQVFAELPGTRARWFAVRCDAETVGWVHENFLAPARP